MRWAQYKRALHLYFSQEPWGAPHGGFWSRIASEINDMVPDAPDFNARRRLDGMRAEAQRDPCRLRPTTPTIPAMPSDGPDRPILPRPETRPPA